MSHLGNLPLTPQVLTERGFFDKGDGTHVGNLLNGWSLRAIFSKQAVPLNAFVEFWRDEELFVVTHDVQTLGELSGLIINLPDITANIIEGDKQL